MISQRTIWSVQPHQRIRKILYIHELTMTGKLIFHKKLWELFWFPFRHALLFSFFVLSVPLKKPVDYKTAYPHVLSFTCYVKYHEGVKVPPTFSPTRALQSWVMHYATAARHGLSQAFFPHQHPHDHFSLWAADISILIFIPPSDTSHSFMIQF